MLERILSVAQLNEYVRRTLAADPMLKGVRLRGEISNFKRHSAGHLYFSLKDEEARIACVMFRSAAMNLRVQPRDGMRVVLTGSASLYSASGQYQFYVDGIRDDGVGELYLAFEQLKNALQAEGLFDPGLKKPLPMVPRGVGIVTSPTGAVVHDIEQVAKRRNPGIQLYLQPSAVQGEGAAADVARGIRALDARPEVDVIIIGRGGGSLEELWAFNEETVARAIFACHTPVVSAVGHETDFTIADFVADVRAATPSQAAEMTIPKLDDLIEILGGMRWRMDRAQAQRITLLGHRVDGLLAKLNVRHPDRRIREQRAALSALWGLLTVQGGANFAARRMKLSALRGRLDALSPGMVLERGYALVTDGAGRLVTDAGVMADGERLSIRLRKGALDARVMEVYHGEEENHD